MKYLYLDESGDLGFDFSKKQTSKYFIITIIAVNNTNVVEKIVKKVFKSFTDKQKKKRNGGLHCHYEDEQTRKKLLSLVESSEIQIFCVFLDKEKTVIGKEMEKHILYNYITNVIIERFLTSQTINNQDSIFLTASKWESNKQFNQTFLEEVTKNVPSDKFSMQIKPAQEDKGLQIVDFVSWAIFRNLEFNDSSYINIFKDKIKEISTL